MSQINVVNLDMVKNDSLVISFSVLTALNGGVIFDLTGSTIVFTATGNDVSISKSIGSGITITDEDAGTGTVELLPADTSNVRLVSGAGDLFYSLKLTTAAGQIFTLVQGRLRVYA